MNDFMEPIIKAYYSQMESQLEGEVLRACQKVGVSVDKDRLMQALTDAREFWNDGYKDGYRAAVWAKPRWISVTERLPKKKGEYLVYDEWGYGAVIKTAYWTPKYEGFDETLLGRAIWYNYDSEYGCYELNGITHWMPLPEKPEEEV